MLKAYNKLPDLNSSVILIVGSPGVGKYKLAKTLLKIDPNVQVHVASHLPLPADIQGKRPRIDFVVFMIDLTNRESFMSAKQSLKFLDGSYFVGKVCFVVTSVTIEGQFHCVSADSVSLLAEAYNSQMLCSNIQNEDELHHLSEQLIKKLHLSLGRQRNISSMLVDCTRVISKPVFNF